MLPFGQSRRQFGKLLATGQLTSYGSGTGVDDGAFRKGIVKSYTVLTLGQYSGTTNIVVNSKTDAHSNNCVFDNNTGLMWSRTKAASVGPASNGLLPWTTNANGEGIFAYCAAANAALLAGYSDWRIPSLNGLLSLMCYEAPKILFDSTAFPVMSGNIRSATTYPADTTKAMYINSLNSTDTYIYYAVKTGTMSCILVRG